MKTKRRATIPVMNSTVHQLKISMREIKPLIWRRVLVPSQIRLSDLHEVIQCTMPWLGYHLHQFILGDMYFGQPSPDDDLEFEVLNEKDYLLDELPMKSRTTLLYEYDFGDDWFHEIRIEKILPADERQFYPVCVAGARAAPPEDCGGPGGYSDLVETLSDPENDQYDEMKTWAESLLNHPFDPQYFDLERINQNLARRFKARTKRWSKQKSPRTRLTIQP